MASPSVPVADSSQRNTTPPAAMPAYREAAFARIVGARLRTSGDAILPQLIREQEAMSCALQDQNLRAAMIQGLQQMMAAEQPNAHYALLQAEAEREMASILTNRIHDLAHFKTLLSNPDFIAKAQAEAAQPSPPPMLLPPSKAEEVIRRLVQPADPGGAEPAVHVAASALGHQIVHQALAKLFDPNGILHQPMMQALTAAAPDLPQEVIHQETLAWLTARQGPAQAVADGLAPTGALYQEAMRRAEQLQREKYERPAANDNAFAAPLKQTTALYPIPLTPAEIEAQKTRQQKAEDVIYTLNHAATCLGITDTFVGPWVGAFSEHWFGNNWFDHGHDHDHDHGHDHHDHSPKSFWQRLGGWVIGEMIGDLGAVPITIAIQRTMPSFMHGIRRLLEPMVGGIFHRRALASAESWADKRGIARDAREVVDRAQRYYDYELDHLPQMMVWTTVSPLLNYATMKVYNPEMAVGTFIRGKAVGSAITAGIVFGARAFSPATAHWWDENVGKHVIVPITKKVGGVFGIEAKDVEQFHARYGNDNAPAAQVQSAQHVGPLAAPAAQAAVQ